MNKLEKKTKGTILVVDDDTITIEVIKAILSKDFNIESAGDGNEAMAQFNKNPPDFVITDWNMPGMNGLELVQAIKHDPANKNIPIIMMTGYMTDMDNLLTAYNAGVIDFIRKPFDSMELKARANSIYQLSVFYREELERKERELLLNTMRLAEMNHFVIELVSKIESKVQKDITIIEDLKKSLNSRILESTWNQFNESFLKTHPDFERRLVQKHSNISPAELKLAALLRLNLNTKEISAILHLSPDGLKVSRSRLRKKLQIENKVNLTGYLMKF